MIKKILELFKKHVAPQSTRQEVHDLRAYSQESLKTCDDKIAFPKNASIADFTFYKEYRESDGKTFVDGYYAKYQDYYVCLHGHLCTHAYITPYYYLRAMYDQVDRLKIDIKSAIVYNTSVQTAVVDDV